MADRTQRRMVERDESPRDPFAELTKIMGFDPRVPVRPKPVAANTAPAAAQPDETEDFGIDLEKELMGAFDQGAPTRHASAAAELGSSWLEDAPSEAPDADAWTGEQAAFDQAALELDAFSLDEGFEAAFTASLEEELALDEDWAAQDRRFAAAVDAPDAHATADVSDQRETTPRYLADGPEPLVEAETNELDLPLDFEASGAGATAYAEPVGSELDPIFEQEFETLLANSRLTPPDSGQSPKAGALVDEATSTEPAVSGSGAEPAAEAPAWDQLAGGSAVAFASEPAGQAVLGNSTQFAEADASALDGHPVDAVPASADAAPAWMEVPFDAQPAVDSEAGHDDLAPELDALSSEHDSWNADEFAASVEGEVPTTYQGYAGAASEFPQAAAEPADDRFHLVDERNGHAGEDFAMGGQNDHVAPTLQNDEASGALSDPQKEFATELESAASMAVGRPIDDANGELAYDPAFDAEFEGSGAQDGDTHAAQPASHDADDPFAALAAMAAQYRAGRQAPNWRPETPFTPALATFNAQPAPAGNGGTMQIQQPVRDSDMPDIETVDVPEQAVALADDLDIPEVAQSEQPRSVVSYDDLDAEFAGLLQEMATGEPTRSEAAPQRSAPVHQFELQGHEPAQPHAHSIAAQYPVEPAISGLAASVGQPALDAIDFDQRNRFADAPSDDPEWSEAGYAADDELVFEDRDYEDPARAEEQGPQAARRPVQRGLLVAAFVGGVALLGGIGAAALSFGDGETSGAPVLVRADTGPLKVRPENPGGTQVPNQDSKVYETVTGAPDAEPAQDKLLSTEEEPLDLAEPEPELALGEPQDEVEAAIDAVPGEEADAAGSSALTGGSQDEQAITPKGEDRLEQVIAASEQPAAAELIAVAPRKVRTMIVKPDGTLVPREVTEPEPAAVEPPPAGADAVALEPAAEDGAAAEVAQAPADDAALDPAPPAGTEQAVASSDADAAVETGAVSAPEPAAADASQPAEDADPAEAAPAAPARRQTTQTTPASMRVAPARPAEQPVDIVGEVKPDQTAALAAPAAGAWSMQIASQPTEASARSSYADLARRYGSVLAGRSASIMKAEVAGKGTYYRVRVPASSRNEAVELCTRYKAAGGNCFVSK